MSKVEKFSEGQAWNHVNNLFNGALRHPEELEKVDVFTTRSPALDRALQIGGWARGRMYQFAGKPSSGKTFMTLIAIAEWQSKDPENCACFIDAEFTYDPIWAAGLGIDNNRLLIVKTNEAKVIFEGLLGTVSLNKQTKKRTETPGLLGMIEKGMTIKHSFAGKTHSLNLGKMGVIVLDSIASMAAPAELNSNVGKVNVAPLSRFLAQELRKLTPAVATANVAFLMINHVKTKIGQMFGDPATTPGGAALKHACSVMLMIAPIGGAENILTNDNQERIGHKVRFAVKKNKMGRAFCKAEFFINVTDGVVNVSQQLLDLGVLLNIIERPNNRSYIIMNEKLGSKADALAFVHDNKVELEATIRKAYLDTESEDDVIVTEDEVETIEDSSQLFPVGK